MFDCFRVKISFAKENIALRQPNHVRIRGKSYFAGSWDNVSLREESWILYRVWRVCFQNITFPSGRRLYIVLSTQHIIFLHWRWTFSAFVDLLISSLFCTVFLFKYLYYWMMIRWAPNSVRANITFSPYIHVYWKISAGYVHLLLVDQKVMGEEKRVF